MVLIKRSNHLISHHLWVTQYESYNRVTVQTELVRRLRQLKGMNYGLEFWSETHWYVLWKPRTQRLNFQPRSVSKKFGREFWTRILDQIFSWSWSNNSENFWFWSETIREFLKIFSPGPVLDRQEWPIFRKHFIPVLFFFKCIWSRSKSVLTSSFLRSGTDRFWSVDPWFNHLGPLVL